MSDIDFSKPYLRIQPVSGGHRQDAHVDFWSIVKIDPTIEDLNDPKKEVMLEMIQKSEGQTALNKAVEQQKRATGLPVFNAA